MRIQDLLSRRICEINLIRSENDPKASHLGTAVAHLMAFGFLFPFVEGFFVGVCKCFSQNLSIEKLILMPFVAGIAAIIYYFPICLLAGLISSPGLFLRLVFRIGLNCFATVGVVKILVGADPDFYGKCLIIMTIVAVLFAHLLAFSFSFQPRNVQEKMKENGENP